MIVTDCLRLVWPEGICHQGRPKYMSPSVVHIVDGKHLMGGSRIAGDLKRGISECPNRGTVSIDQMAEAPETVLDGWCLIGSWFQGVPGRRPVNRLDDHTLLLRRVINNRAHRSRIGGY